MAAYEQRFYQTVNALNTEQDDFTPANGQRLAITKMGGDGIFETVAHVRIIWDADGTPEILFSTHGAQTQESIREIIGDGSKVLRIELINDDVNSHDIGAFILGELYG